MKAEENISTEVFEEGIPQEEAKPSFRQVLAHLPKILMTEVIKRLATAILIFIVTVIMLFSSSDWMCCIGFLLSLLVAYMGLDIVWKFGDGKIRISRMVVCKSSTTIKQRDKVHVILRDADVKDLVGTNYETYKYDITVSPRDRGNITSGTILDVYISDSTPNAVLAYEILGEI